MIKFYEHVILDYNPDLYKYHCKVEKITLYVASNNSIESSNLAPLQFSVIDEIRMKEMPDRDPSPKYLFLEMTNTRS